MLYQITLDDGCFRACFGVETDNDIVTDIAPIWRFTKGWHIEKLKNYVERKKGEIKEVK